MSSILGTITELFGPFLLTKACPRVIIEEWTFRLHFRLTSLFLFLFSALLSMRQYLGDHIKCQPNHDDDSNDPIIPLRVIENYCFIQTTFTVPYNLQTTTLTRIRTDMNVGGPQYFPPTSNTIHHAYYQWVPFFLFFIGIYFLFTHHVWKAVENGKVKSLVAQLNSPSLKTFGCSKREEMVKGVAKYLVDAKGTHASWAFCYVLAEFGNLFVLLSTMYITDLFLGQEFTSYGPKVIQFLDADPETRVDPMATVFPRVTKCLFHMFGPTGTIQRFDAICILTSNILNEKIFTFLWFWFVFVTILTLFALVHRFIILVSKRMRMRNLLGSGLSSNFTLNAQSVTVIRKLDLGDWFLLRMINLNLDQDTFHQLIQKLYEQMI